MTNSLTRRLRLPALVLALVLGVGAGAAALSRSGSDSSLDPSAAARSVSTATLDRRPASSARAAVEAVLRAEQEGDADASFALLSPAGVEEFPDVEAWARRRSELPAITGFEVEGVEGNEVEVLVEHVPGLDAFVGLSPAMDRQRWTARRGNGGWLVDPEPVIQPVLPDAGPARETALRWAQAVQRCEQPEAEGMQVEPTLVGTSSMVASLCRSAGDLQAAKPERISAGPGTADLVGRYGDATLRWARQVRVSSGDLALLVILGPIGEEWRVVSVIDG